MMVVKSKRGRRRYVAFTLSETFTKETLAGKLSAYSGGTEFKVIQCASGWCIVRSAPNDVRKVIEMMSHADPASKSVSTSGTLITLRSKYPPLESTRIRHAR